MKQRKNKYQRKILQVKLGLLLVGVMVLVMGSFAVAKYYSLHVQKGVGVASDFYFESDVLQKVPELTEEEWGKLVPYPIQGQWSETGQGESRFHFLIKNYRNKFQYNQGVDITYDVYVKLAEEDSTKISYQIKYGTVQKLFTHQGVGGQVATTTSFDDPAYRAFTGIVLKKDTLSKNEFEININPNGVAQYPKDIYIWAIPTDPTYINRILAGKLTFQEGRGEFSVSGGFAMDALNTNDYTEKIKDYSGFTYQVVTNGIPEDENLLNKDGTVPVTVKWNAKYLKIDRFNKYYQQYLKSSNLSSITPDDSGWCSMDISLEPDSAGKIVFFRADDFATIKTYTDFCALVTYTSTALKVEEESQTSDSAGE